MKYGVVFPQVEFGSDPRAVQEYTRAAESSGYDYIEAFDHVLGANPDRPGGWQGAYTYQSSFLEPFVLFAYMAAVTLRVGLATNVIILPQRQTALVAKQAATLDVLSGGRVRLGVGLGWNEVEYIALRENFHNRGRRLEEQVEVLRALWTRPLVTFKGRWHEIPDAGLNPLPVQRPIPIWLGGRAEEAIRRIARMADGWMTNFRDPAQARPYFEQLHKELDIIRRDPATLPIEARIPHADGWPETWQGLVQQWQDMGVSYISINTMGCGLSTPGAHIAAIRRFAETLIGR